MAWTYHDYEEQTDDSLRLTGLRRHISEVQAAIQANLASDGDSRQNDVLEKYLTNVLTPRRKELEARVGTLSAASPKATGMFTRGVPA